MELLLDLEQAQIPLGLIPPKILPLSGMVKRLWWA